MGKKILTVEQQLKKFKKRFHLVFTILIIVVCVFGFYIYLNYDYLAFKHFISQNYVYTEALESLYEKKLGQKPNGRYYTYFDALAISAVTEKIQNENKDKYTYLYTPEQLKVTLADEKKEADLSNVATIDKSTAYIKITNFSKYTLDFFENQTEVLKNYTNLIIDLRDNYGGDVFALYKMADFFLPKGSTLAVDKMRFITWTYKAKKDQLLKFDKIVILQNGNTASSSEGFIAALKENLRDNVILIGDTTFGKGIGQFTLPLKKGFAVKATVMKWYTPDGNDIHNKGIPPDIFYSKEDIIQFAKETLKP